METQIKMKVTLARSTSLPGSFNPPYGHQANGADEMGMSTEPQSPFEKIGTYKAVKIRAGMGARRRVRKNADKGVDPNSLGAFRPEEVLFLYTEVWCTDHPVRAFACARCVNRERRRAQARAPTAKKGVPPSESDEPVNGLSQAQSSLGGMDPVHEPVDEEGLTQEDKERILLFNCGPLVELVDGECDLPARLTCYCKHHKEKTGFRVVFQLRDHLGRLVASGTTPPVMITDDHKTPTNKAASVTSAITDGGVSASSKGVTPLRSKPRTKKVRESSASTEEDRKSSASKKPRQAKPYDRKAQWDARSTVSNAAPVSPRGSFTPLGLSMTPLHGRSVPGSPLVVTGNRGSYFVPNGMAEPGSGAISPSLVMSGGPHEGQSQWPKQGSPNGLTAALPAISQQLSQWAANNGQEQLSHQESEPVNHVNGMPMDDQSWQFSLQDPNMNPMASGEFAQMISANAGQFQLQQPNFGNGMVQDQHQSRSNLGLMPFGQVDHTAMLQQSVSSRQIHLVNAQPRLTSRSNQPSHRLLEPEPDFESMLNFSPQSSPSTLPQDFASPISDLQDASTSGWSPLAPHQLSSTHFAQQPLPVIPSRPRPAINRLVPAEGPTHGGIEVTILGENFHPGMVCMFGAFPAVTVQSYGPTTLVCLLPPNPNPGPVQVQVIGEEGQPVQLLQGQQPAIFTYNDTTDRKLYVSPGYT